MTETLRVQTAHRSDCRFGPGLYRVTYDGTSGPQVRFCQTQAEVEGVHRLLRGIAEDLRIERDGYCLDGQYGGDANTPDVVDAEHWLALPQAEAMAELGLTSETDYARAYRSIEAAVVRRENRLAQSGVRASIVIKKKGAPVVDA